MTEMSTSRLNDEKSELSNDVRAVRSVLKAVGGQEATLAFPAGSKKTVRFALQEPDRAGPERPSRAASELETSNNCKRASRCDRRTIRSREAILHRMEEFHLGLMRLCTRRCQKQLSGISPTDGTVSGRTMTKYNGNSPEVTLDRSVE